MANKIPLADIERELVERAPDSLYRFVKLAWGLVEPSPYNDNWHIPLVCEYLQAVSACEIMRLVINEPPGCTKSLLVSVFWPAWEWTQRPETKFMYASYDASLPRRDGQRMLRILQSRWWEQRWKARLTEQRPAASNFENTDGGVRFGTSPDGKATGRHVDIQVADDPVKPKELMGSMAVAIKAIEKVSTWWKGTMSTRRADPATFRRVIVMQRIHEADLAGEMLRDEGYDHLMLEMTKTSVQCPCSKACTPDDPREDGELLWESRFPRQVIIDMETKELGPTHAAAQLQQRPTPAGGGILKKEWYRYWHHQPMIKAPQDDQFPCRDEYCRVLPEAGQWIQSWDMTFKDTDGSDFVAGGLWLYTHPDAFLVWQVCARMSFVESCQAVVDLTARQPKSLTKLVEDKANGPAVENALKSKVPGIVLVNPEGGKESRAHSVSGLFQAGNVYIPHPSLAPWVHDYRVQLSTFPRGVNDDMVDQTTQALVRLSLGSTRTVEAMKALIEQMCAPTPQQSIVANSLSEYLARRRGA